jgi:hypothetical protein
MSKSNFEDQEDQNLVAFIRQHKPIAPPPSVNLEQQILVQIEQIPVEHAPVAMISQTKGRIRRLTKALWLLPAAIAIGAGLFLANNRQPQFALSEAESLEIEAALISSWSDAIDYDLDAVGDPYSEPAITELTDELTDDTYGFENGDQNYDLAPESAAE